MLCIATMNMQLKYEVGRKPNQTSVTYPKSCPNPKCPLWSSHIQVSRYICQLFGFSYRKQSEKIDTCRQFQHHLTFRLTSLSYKCSCPAGAEVSALATHHYGLGSIPELRLFLIIRSSRWVFSPGTPISPLISLIGIEIMILIKRHD